jgi:Activator of Hsp90 ATPase homolog 1-like protein
MAARKAEKDTGFAATMTSDRELVIARIIDAPRERVFKAWTDPELLKQGSRLCPIRHPSWNLTFGRAAPTTLWRS